MELSSFISYSGGALCLILAAATLLRKTRSLPWLFFAIGMVLLAGDAVTGGLTLAARSEMGVESWERLRFGVLALLPGTWLLFSLSYARGNYREFVAKWRWLLAAAFVVPVVAFGVFNDDLMGKIVAGPEPPDLLVRLGPAGRILNLTMLVGSILVLLNFERTFRSAIGIMRWRIKYFVLGAALAFCGKIYIASQALLYSGTHGVSLQINAVVILAAALLMAYSLLRTRLADSEVYPSHKVLQQSLTAVVAGLYLVCLGLLANWAARLGPDPAFPLKAFLLMVGIVGLTVLVLSDRFQQKTKLFVSRNFSRPIHDYRKVWSDFTERTGSIIDPTALCRVSVKSISETFELLSVTLWLVGEHEKGLILGASTSLTEEKAAGLAMLPGAFDGLLLAARGWTGPVDIDGSTDKSLHLLKALNPDHFHKGGSRVAVSLLSGGQLVGLITVADRVSGLPFSVEDFDLLKCIADQVAGSLRNIQLTQKLMQSKEMEAFQAMSAFLVHDLKNTASTLSLMLQNLSTHFGDPNFREDCLRSLSRGVTHINDLIKRLALLRHELKLQKVETDLNELVNSVLGELEMLKGLSLTKDLQSLPKISADAEQLHKVLTNLLLNAQEAVGAGGAVSVRTTRENGWVIMAVADDGCGMSPEFMRRSLFRPFQTTKKSGLGIGMFHTKAIVEAHQGRIEVESKEGRGTTFRILLPVHSEG